VVLNTTLFSLSLLPKKKRTQLMRPVNKTIQYFYQKSLLQLLQCHCFVVLPKANMPHNATLPAFDKPDIFLQSVDLQ
jgi:hypothetical protein